MNRPIKENTQHQTASALSAEHDRLELWFRELTERAASGDSRECDDVWSDFAQQLENHMAYEEREIFPRYAQSGAAGADMVALLREEHAEIRKQLEALGVDLQLHVVNAEAINAFLTSLREHARREGESLYPWLAAKTENTAGV